MAMTVFDQPYPLVTLDEVKVAIGEYSNDRNGLIDGLITAAQGEMDGPNGWLGMCVAVQGVEWVSDCLDGDVRLPIGPAIDPVEVYYIDADGVEQVMDAASYRLAAGQLILASGASWPSVSGTSAVRVRYYAGISDEFDPRIAMLKTAIMMHVRMTLDGVEREAGRKAMESLVRPLWVSRC